jgi:hypothetical protein
MRQFIIAAAVAVGLIVFWAAILPLTAEAATQQATATSAGMSRALFLCRQNGLDQACVGALAKALTLDATNHAFNPASSLLSVVHQPSERASCKIKCLQSSTREVKG